MKKQFATLQAEESDSSLKLKAERDEESDSLNRNLSGQYAARKSCRRMPSDLGLVCALMLVLPRAATALRTGAHGHCLPGRRSCAGDLCAVLARPLRCQVGLLRGGEGEEGGSAGREGEQGWPPTDAAPLEWVGRGDVEAAGQHDGAAHAESNQAEQAETVQAQPEHAEGESVAQSQAREPPPPPPVVEQEPPVPPVVVAPGGEGDSGDGGG